MIESFDEKLFKNKETEADDGELYLKYDFHGRFKLQRY